MVLFDLCFGVEFLCCLNFMYVFYSFSLLSLGNCVAENWKIAAHSAYEYKNLIVNLVFL